MANDRDRDSLSRSYGAGYAIVAAGFQLVFSILFFMGMGWLLDRWLHTTPAFMLVGLIVGLAAGFYVFLVKVNQEVKEEGGTTGGGKKPGPPAPPGA